MSNFSRAIDIIIAEHEGGFQKRADDPGNWTPSGELKGTKFGISAHSFPDVDIEDLTIAGAEEIYRQHWGVFAQIADQQVMTKVLDMAVNMQFAGHGPATTILQKAICQAGIQIAIDGDLGPRTITACNNLRAEKLLPGLCKMQLEHYLDLATSRPSEAAWLPGWKKRAEWIPPVEEKA